MSQTQEYNIIRDFLHTSGMNEMKKKNTSLMFWYGGFNSYLKANFIASNAIHAALKKHTNFDLTTAKTVFRNIAPEFFDAAGKDLHWSKVMIGATATAPVQQVSIPTPVQQAITTTSATPDIVAEFEPVGDNTFSTYGSNAIPPEENKKPNYLLWGGAALGAYWLYKKSKKRKGLSGVKSAKRKSRSKKRVRTITL